MQCFLTFQGSLHRNTRHGIATSRTRYINAGQSITCRVMTRGIPDRSGRGFYFVPAALTADPSINELEFHVYIRSFSPTLRNFAPSQENARSLNIFHFRSETFRFRFRSLSIDCEITCLYIDKTNDSGHICFISVLKSCMAIGFNE